MTVMVLYIGDSETVVSRYAVGADVFEQSYFNDNGKYPCAIVTPYGPAAARTGSI